MSDTTADDRSTAEDINAYLAEFSFGLMPWETVKHSMELFSTKTMPMVRDAFKAAAKT